MSTGGQLHVHLLGGFRVSVDARTVGDAAWRQKRAAAVVKLLALEPGHRLHREQITDALWPDLSPEAAANNLRFALHHARRQLEAAGAVPATFLTRDGDQLTLGPPELIWVDVDAFEQAVASAWRSEEIAIHQRAITLYTGDLLPEDLYDDWAADRRTALRASYLMLLNRLADQYERRGEAEQAIAAWQLLLASEPIQEVAHIGLMRLYALSGQARQALEQYKRLCDLLDGELDTEPEPATLELAEAIQAGRFPTTGLRLDRQLAERSAGSVSPEHSRPSPVASLILPFPLTGLVGRERELAELRQLLTTSRLLTLTGNGGTGKTRLALAVAQALKHLYPDGVGFVSLAPVRDPELVVSAIAQALGVRESGGQVLVEAVHTYLRDKRLMLVLDNFEQVVDAAPILADMLERNPRLTMLVTSRMRLRLRGEQEYPVPPLPHPDPTRLLSTNMLLRYPSVALFLQRVQEVRPDFQITSETAPAIAGICAGLSGLPLAIELAAARSKVLPLRAILARLDRPLELLTGGPRDAPERQQTMANAIRWSYELLDPAEQRLLQRLSVFAGGWTLDAAEAVVGPVDKLGVVVLDGLTSLVDTSLVTLHVHPQGVARFSMLELIREFGLEQLAASGEARQTHGQHAAFFLTLTEQAGLELEGPDPQTCLNRLETEHDNLRAALQWTVDAGAMELGVRLAGNLWEFWNLHGDLSEGRRWLAATLQASAGCETGARAEALRGAGVLAQRQGEHDIAARLLGESLAMFRRLHADQGVARAQNGLGIVAFSQGDERQAQARWEQSLALFERVGDTLGAARTLNNLGILAIMQEDYEQARNRLEANVTLQRRIGNTRGLAFSLNNLGVVAYDQGAYERAREWLEESLAMFRSLGDRMQAAHAESCLGQVAYALEEYEQARQRFEESLAVSKELDDWPQIATCVRLLGQIALASHEPQHAARMFGAAEALYESYGEATSSPSARRVYEQAVATLRATLDETALAAAWAEGRQLSPDEAIDSVFTTASAGHHPDEYPRQPLTA